MRTRLGNCPAASSRNIVELEMLMPKRGKSSRASKILFEFKAVTVCSFVVVNDGELLGPQGEEVP